MEEEEEKEEKLAQKKFSVMKWMKGVTFMLKQFLHRFASSSRLNQHFLGCSGC